MNPIRIEREIAGRTLSIETGKVAKQAEGAVVVQYGDTVVLATVLAQPSQRDLDFFPLFVDYRENQYAAGKVPGGFFKREGRPSTKEILTMRMIDRPIRPLFPKDYRHEVQIQCLVLSTDNENDPDMLALWGASAALAISPAPFEGPIGAARMGYVDGEYVVNPTHAQLESSLMDLLVCGPREAVNMIECSGHEASEEIVAEGIRRGFEVAREVIGMIDELVERVQPVKDYEPTGVPADLVQAIQDKYAGRLREAKSIPGKQDRGQAVGQVREEALAEFCPPEAAEEELTYTPAQVREAFYQVEGKVQRQMILDGHRPDGRGFKDVRPLSIEVGVLPRTHGSALFTRGETQALATCTLGTPRDEQIIDGLREEYKKSFMLHYNFPPFCVGEIRPIRGPGRREIGHGALAEKSLEAVMPPHDDFPYTVRIVADMLESNGSTSMATVCGGTLAMMDAGVPITAPVAGISIGMVTDPDDFDKYVLLTDIIGEEDFHGDMDFKVAGTAQGITGIQLDMKARGIPHDRIVETLAQAKDARRFILQAMEGVLPQPREQLSKYAPCMMVIKIPPDKIGKVIGPGGKMINQIQDETGATIDIEDDGSVYIAADSAEKGQAARTWVENLTAEARVGQNYTGKVVSVRDFGAFIEILPGTDGLCHVSELSDRYVKNVTDVVNVGDTVEVKCINIDDEGRVKLSRKALLKERGISEAGEGEEVPAEQQRQRGEGGEGGGGGGKRRRRRPARR